MKLSSEFKSAWKRGPFLISVTFKVPSSSVQRYSLISVKVAVSTVSSLSASTGFNYKDQLQIINKTDKQMFTKWL